jgi:hypothetical protein
LSTSKEESRHHGGASDAVQQDVGYYLADTQSLGADNQSIDSDEDSLGDDSDSDSIHDERATALYE